MKLLSSYFCAELSKLGYPISDVRYSLGYCQGDGMAFYGALDGTELSRVAKRLLSKPAELAAITRSISKGVVVEICRKGSHHYVHWNTMSVDQRYEYSDDGLTDFEQNSLDRLICLMDEEVKEISRRLESEGYALIEAGRPADNLERTFRTNAFKVTIKRVEDDTFDMDDWDQELRQKLYKEMISGKTGYFGVVVTIECCGMPAELASVGCYGMVGDIKSPSFYLHGTTREMVSEAVSEARDSYRSLVAAKVKAA